MLKLLSTTIFTLLFYTLSFCQCSTVSASVSSSDTSFIQLYHAGFFNIPSGFANVCDWEITRFDGSIVHEATTSGNDAFEQGRTDFNHNVPITDSMRVSIIITNQAEGISCTITDTLFWQETEVLPGSFIGNWEVLNFAGGEEDQLTSIETGYNESIYISPSIAASTLYFSGNTSGYNFTIFDLNGNTIKSIAGLNNKTQMDISTFSKGIYFVRFYNVETGEIINERFIKQ